MYPTPGYDKGMKQDLRALMNIVVYTCNDIEQLINYRKQNDQNPLKELRSSKEEVEKKITTSKQIWMNIKKIWDIEETREEQSLLRN